MDELSRSLFKMSEPMFSDDVDQVLNSLRLDLGKKRLWLRNEEVTTMSTFVGISVELQRGQSSIQLDIWLGG